MRKYTQFHNFDEMLASGGFAVENKEDFEKIPDDVFDNHIRATTSFASWQNMMDTATEQYVSKKLGF